MKEKQISAIPTDPHGAAVKTEYKFGLGMFVAIISGVLSACFNFGLEAGKPLADVANEAWKSANPGEGEFLYRNNVIYVVVLWGGLTTNFIWCMILNARNKTFGDYTNKKLRYDLIIFLPHWPALPGSCNFSFMVWVKVSWVMGQVPGYCIWPL